MKHTLLLTLSAFTMAAFMTACSSKIPFVDTEVVIVDTDECTDINKKLVKVDRFLEVVNKTSAFHLVEAAEAITTPGITSSNNKPQMLRDGNKRKSELLAEHQKFGCEMPETE